MNEIFPLELKQTTQLTILAFTLIWCQFTQWKIYIFSCLLWSALQSFIGIYSE